MLNLAPDAIYHPYANSTMSFNLGTGGLQRIPHCLRMQQERLRLLPWKTLEPRADLSIRVGNWPAGLGLWVD